VDALAGIREIALGEMSTLALTGSSYMVCPIGPGLKIICAMHDMKQSHGTVYFFRSRCFKHGSTTSRHAAWGRMLKVVAEALALTSPRGRLCLVRLGGDEFRHGTQYFQARIEMQATARQIAERTLSALGYADVNRRLPRSRVGCSISWCVLHRLHGNALKEVCWAGRKALYKAKASGKAPAVFYLG